MEPLVEGALDREDLVAGTEEGRRRSSAFGSYCAVGLRSN
jgi:hypothetical protein